MTLTKREAATVKRLLGAYQDCLESAIQSELAPGETFPRDAEIAAYVYECRSEWCDAENLINKLEAVA